MQPATPLFSLRTLNYCLGFVIAVYAVNFVGLGFLMSPFDYDHMAGYYEIAWRYWRYGRGLPHFNPLLCGGRPLAGDPQVPIFHPLIPLVPVLGAVWLIKLEQLFQLGLGVAGLIGIVRRFGLGREEITWSVLCYLCGGAVVSRFLAGHVAVGFYLMLPLFFHWSYQIHDGPVSKRWLLKYWGLFYYAYLHKPNFPIYVIPTLLVETTIRSLLTRQLRPLVHLGLACAIGLILNLPTYITANDYFTLYPRIADGIPNAIPIYTLVLNLLLPLKTLPEAAYGPHFFGRHEYSVFLGIVPVVLALIGITLQFRNESSRSLARALLISLVVWSLFSIGVGAGTESPDLNLLRPYTWLHRFWPGFTSVRAPPRFWFAPFLCTILFSALAFRVRVKFPKSLLVVVTLLPLVLHAGINLSKTTVLSRQTQWGGPNVFCPDFRWVNSEEHHNYYPIRRGDGVARCFFNIEIPQADLVEGPLLPSVLGAELRWTAWNRIGVLASKTPGSLVAFNINHAPYWRFEGTGALLSSRDGERLAITATGPTISGEIVYELPRLRLTLFIALGAAVLLAVVLLLKFDYHRWYGFPTNRPDGKHR